MELVPKVWLQIPNSWYSTKAGGRCLAWCVTNGYGSAVTQLQLLGGSVRQNGYSTWKRMGALELSGNQKKIACIHEYWDLNVDVLLSRDTRNMKTGHLICIFNMILLLVRFVNEIVKLHFLSFEDISNILLQILSLCGFWVMRYKHSKYMFIPIQQRSNMAAIKAKIIIVRWY